MRTKLEWLIRWLKRTWQEVTQFCSLAWRGAALGSVAVTLLFCGYMGCHLRIGYGAAVDVVFGLLMGALGITLAGLALMLVATIFRACPRLFAAGCLGSLVFLVALFGPRTAPMWLVLILLGALIGAAAGVLAAGARQKTKRGQDYVAQILLTALLLGTGLLAYWVLGTGDDPNVGKQPPVTANVPPLAALNPAQPGPYKVLKMTYGSGTDRHRPEFGGWANLKTKTVDATQMLPQFKGFSAKLRKWYWGFGPEEFPVNGRVWYPQGAGPFPLVLCVHGNHNMEEYSDPGYAYLGELLASRGFIFVSVDENFLNFSFRGPVPRESGARGWILLQHLAVWRGWNGAQGHPFFQKVDLNNIALIGHSRGGEAVAHAAAFNRLSHFPDNANIRFNFGFAIKSVIAIAPIDGQYEAGNQPTPVENVNYFVLQGSHDSDVSIFAGFRPYRRAKFTDGNYWMKSALYIYRANHGQFNTVWGDNDIGPFGFFLNRKPLLKGDEQRQIAKVYISAFLEATLRGHGEYIPMFRDYRTVAGWLPQTIYVNQFEDSNYRIVSDYDQSIDVTRTTVAGGSQAGQNLALWRQQEWKGRGDWPFRNGAVFLGWDNKPTPANASYEIHLPVGLARDWRLTEKSLLAFSLADADMDPHALEVKTPGQEKPKTEKKDKDSRREPVDFTIELVAANGAVARMPLSQFYALQPAFKVRFTKLDYIESNFYKTPTEPVFQSYEIPLAAFAKAAAGFDPHKLTTIRFRFDRSERGVILLDEVGFAAVPLPSTVAARLK